jgi:hypothetical protein
VAHVVETLEMNGYATAGLEPDEGIDSLQEPRLVLSAGDHICGDLHLGRMFDQWSKGDQDQTNDGKVMAGSQLGGPAGTL